LRASSASSAGALLGRASGLADGVACLSLELVTGASGLGPGPPGGLARLALNATLGLLGLALHALCSITHCFFLSDVSSRATRRQAGRISLLEVEEALRAALDLLVRESLGPPTEHPLMAERITQATSPFPVELIRKRID